VKGSKVATREGGGGRQRLKSDDGTVQFAVNVVGEVLGNLQDAALDLGLFKACHAVKGKDREAQQRQSQS
jgi:hypothetical protein